MRVALSLSKRFDILKRDDFTCRYCGSTSATAKLEVDHVISVAAGGTNHEGNLVTACFECNRGKRAKSLLPAPPEPIASGVAQADTKLVWRTLFGDLPMSDDKVRTIRTFLRAHGTDETLRAAMVAKGKDGLQTDDRWRYFCGVNWRWIKAGISDSSEVIQKRPRFNHKRVTAWTRLNPPPET